MRRYTAREQRLKINYSRWKFGKIQVKRSIWKLNNTKVSRDRDYSNMIEIFISDQSVFLKKL